MRERFNRGLRGKFLCGWQWRQMALWQLTNSLLFYRRRIASLRGGKGLVCWLDSNVSLSHHSLFPRGFYWRERCKIDLRLKSVRTTNCFARTTMQTGIRKIGGWPGGNVSGGRGHNSGLGDAIVGQQFGRRNPFPVCTHVPGAGESRTNRFAHCVGHRGSPPKPYLSLRRMDVYVHLLEWCFQKEQHCRIDSVGQNRAIALRECAANQAITHEAAVYKKKLGIAGGAAVTRRR